MASSDPFAFSKNRGPGRAPAPAPSPQEWVFPAQAQALPNVGTMGTIGQAAPFVPAPAPASAPATAAAFSVPASAPGFFPAPAAAVHQRAHAPAAAMPSGAFDPSVIAQVASNPMAQLGMQYGRDMVQGSVARYMPGAAAAWTNLQYYFDVNNTYVMAKIIRVLAPFTTREWDRKPSSSADSDTGRPAGSSRFAPPSLDVAAPDLYIPLMAFITYVLACGLLKGMRQKFSPEVLVNATSAGLVTSIIEVAALRFCLYTTSTEGCSIVDLVALAGYKYVSMVVCAAVGLFLGSRAYYAALLYVGLAMAYFIINSLMPLVRAAGELAGGAAASPTRSPVILVIGVLQLLFMWWIGLALEA